MAGPVAAAGLELSMSLTPDNVMVCAVDPYPLAVLSGVAMVDQTRFVKTVVELRAASRWVCQVEPSTLYFDGDYPLAFSVTVNIPYGTLPTETCEVVVSGVCNLGGVAVSNATAIANIFIQDYAVFRLDFDVSQGYLVQGQDREMRFMVHNLANVPLRLELTVEDTPHGATVILPSGNPELRSNEIVNYTFELRTDDDIATDYQGITFSVKAFDSNGGEVQTRKFVIPLDIESRTGSLGSGSLPLIIALALAGGFAALLWMHRRRKSRRADAHKER